MFDGILFCVIGSENLWKEVGMLRIEVVRKKFAWVEVK